MVAYSRTHLRQSVFSSVSIRNRPANFRSVNLNSSTADQTFHILRPQAIRARTHLATRSCVRSSLYGCRMALVRPLESMFSPCSPAPAKLRTIIRAAKWCSIKPRTTTWSADWPSAKLRTQLPLAGRPLVELQDAAIPVAVWRPARLRMAALPTDRSTDYLPAPSYGHLPFMPPAQQAAPSTGAQQRREQLVKQSNVDKPSGVSGGQF